MSLVPRVQIISRSFRLRCKDPQLKFSFRYHSFGWLTEVSMKSRISLSSLAGSPCIVHRFSLLKHAEMFIVVFVHKKNICRLFASVNHNSKRETNICGTVCGVQHLNQKYSILRSFTVITMLTRSSTPVDLISLLRGDITINFNIQKMM